MNNAFQDFKTRIFACITKERSIIYKDKLTPAAVLVSFVPRDNDPSLILTLRTMNVARHKGQVSLPGGVKEPQDQGMIATALREAEEEISLDPTMIEIAGVLDDQETTSGFLITPVVGFISREATFKPNPQEVAEIFEAPFSQLTDPANYQLKRGIHRGVPYTDHRYNVANHTIWGATGRIIHDMLKMLK